MTQALNRPRMTRIRLILTDKKISVYQSNPCHPWSILQVRLLEI
jgi:hypothetical protein